MPPALRTTDEQLADLVAQLGDDSSGSGACYHAARGAFTTIHTVYSMACSSDAHPAIIRRCALLLETLADDLAYEASSLAAGDAEDALALLCGEILAMSESLVLDAEHSVWMCDDDWLADPPHQEQRGGATLDESDGWDMPAKEQLAALTELLAQDSAIDGQWLCWRWEQERFMKYYFGFRNPKLHPAVAHHCARRMCRHVGGMARYGLRTETSKKFHERAKALLWEIVEDACADMYAHDETDVSTIGSGLNTSRWLPFRFASAEDD